MDSKGIELLCENQLEYLFLVSLISSDNILTLEDAENRLKNIDEAEAALKEANVPEKKKKEIEKYLAKGRRILKGDIEEFKKNK